MADEQNNAPAPDAPKTYTQEELDAKLADMKAEILAAIPAQKSGAVNAQTPFNGNPSEARTPLAKPEKIDCMGIVLTWGGKHYGPGVEMVDIKEAADALKAKIPVVMKERDDLTGRVEEYNKRLDQQAEAENV